MKERMQGFILLPQCLPLFTVFLLVDSCFASIRLFTSVCSIQYNHFLFTIHCLILCLLQFTVFLLIISCLQCLYFCLPQFTVFPLCFVVCTTTITTSTTTQAWELVSASFSRLPPCHFIVTGGVPEGNRGRHALWQTSQVVGAFTKSSSRSFLSPFPTQMSVWHTCLP